MRSIFSVVQIVSFISAVFCRTTIETDNYIIWTIPDGAKDVTNIQSASGAAIIGGGSDCIPAFEYMIDHANGGDFVVLRAGGSDAYNDFVYDMSVSMNKTLNSVSTISFLNREASFDSTLLSFIENAEMIFFSGGDQSLYVKYWVGTPVQEIIQKKLASVTVGGTSAGMAILGEWIYT
jgi:cyanophycinase